MRAERLWLLVLRGGRTGERPRRDEEAIDSCADPGLIHNQDFKEGETKKEPPRQPRKRKKLIFYT